MFTQTAQTTCMQLSSIGVVPPPPQQEHCASDFERGRQKSKKGRRCCRVADILRSSEEQTSTEFLFRSTVPEARTKHSFRGHRCDGEAVTAVRKLCVYPRRSHGGGVCKKRDQRSSHEQAFACDNNFIGRLKKKNSCASFKNIMIIEENKIVFNNFV